MKSTKPATNRNPSSAPIRMKYRCLPTLRKARYRTTVPIVVMTPPAINTLINAR